MSGLLGRVLNYIPRLSMVRWQDLIEICILTFLIYHVLIWIRNTRAWSLLKAVLVIAVFYVVSAYLQMNTILWIIQNLFSVALMALVIILQPELRKAL